MLILRRITCQFFNSFSVHRIDLDNIYRFLSQIISNWFCVRSSRFKTNYNRLQAVFFFKQTKVRPKFFKAFHSVIKLKWFNFMVIRSSEVSIMNVFPNINSSNKCFFVDTFNFFRFIKDPLRIQQ